MRNGFDLYGRRILITGAAEGIGAAAARICASLGAELVLLDIKNSEPVAAPIRKAGNSALAVIADVSCRSDVEQVAREQGAVDALVLNAAVCPWDEDWRAPEWDASFERVMNVNVLGPITVVRAFLPAMVERRRGRIDHGGQEGAHH